MRERTNIANIADHRTPTLQVNRYRRFTTGLMSIGTRKVRA